MLARCALIVRSVVPRSAAISLFNLPATTCVRTFALTRCQQFKTPPEFALTRTLLKRRRIPLERPLHGGEKVVFAHRLRQEILGAAFHRVDGGGDVPVAGEEDDRQRIVTAHERRLEVEAAWSRHPQVRDHAAAILWLVPGEKFRGGREGLHRYAPPA